MAERVRITDVSPRDGLQNEPGVIPTADKVRLVELLCATGGDEVEVTSFVSAKWVPQLGDAGEGVKALSCSPSLKEEQPKNAQGVDAHDLPCLQGGSPSEPFAQPPPSSGRGSQNPVFAALVPNERGMQAVLEANRLLQRRLISKVSVFTA